MRRLFTFNVLEHKFEDESVVPRITPASVELVRLLDDGGTSLAKLEEVVSEDPATLAAVLGAANSALYGGRRPQASNPKGAILLLGERAVRLIILSVWLRSVTSPARKASTFVPKRFAEHGMAVGYFAQWIEAGRPSGTVTPDQALLAGALHDVAFAVLAAIDPGLYVTVFAEARMRRCSLNDAFEHIYDRRLEPLSASVARLWGLPKPVVACLESVADASSTAGARIAFGDWWAEGRKRGMTPWPTEPSLDPKVALAADVPAPTEGESDPVGPLDALNRAWQSTEHAA
jgi:HD-like signal output (HDOD) protein